MRITSLSFDYALPCDNYCARLDINLQISQSIFPLDILAIQMVFFFIQKRLGRPDKITSFTFFGHYHLFDTPVYRSRGWQLTGRRQNDLSMYIQICTYVCLCMRKNISFFLTDMYRCYTIGPFTKCIFCIQRKVAAATSVLHTMEMGFKP